MAQDLTGKIIDRYQLIERIGVGGMAVVYRARQTNMARMVAFKVMDTLLVHDPDFVARFRRETDIIAHLEHPHILPVYDYGYDADDGLIYLVTRLMTGGSLQEHLKPEPMPLDYVGRIFRQLGSALDYAHERGVIHRDIKARNVLLDDFGNAYLTDFGIAKLRLWHRDHPFSGHVGHAAVYGPGTVARYGHRWPRRHLWPGGHALSDALRRTAVLCAYAAAVDVPASGKAAPIPGG